MWIANDWQDFEVIDCGDGEKLERWGEIILRRPDPQAIWPKSNTALWETADGVYHRSNQGGGQWTFARRLPEHWNIRYQKYMFVVHPTNFKHTGLFPEQAANWTWMAQTIQSAHRPVQVLNLFAYTGGATIACAGAGASVCHVDAAKGMISWAKENATASNLQNRSIRYIIDDCLKFVQREIRRGKQYDAIIMDPPSYGRGPGGEVWALEDKLFELVHECTKVLCEKPLFFLINSYTTGLQSSVLSNLLHTTVVNRFGGTVDAQEVGLPVTYGVPVLPCGCSARWVGTHA